MIQYYPLSRVRTGFTTAGGVYLLDGKPYKGPYYVTYTGEAFAGKNPVVGDNRQLVPVGAATQTAASEVEQRTSVDSFFPQNATELVAQDGSRTGIRAKGVASIDSYNGLARNSGRVDQIDPIYLTNRFARLKQIVPYYPIVTEADYKKGFFKRYFAKRIVDNGYVMEVSLEDWGKISTKQDQSYENYEVTDMLWQLTGPLKDTRISQYQVKGGVFDTNKRITEAKAKSFIGLIEFIGGDYTKFARITEG